MKRLNPQHTHSLDTATAVLSIEVIAQHALTRGFANRVLLCHLHNSLIPPISFPAIWHSDSWCRREESARVGEFKDNTRAFPVKPDLNPGAAEQAVPAQGSDARVSESWIFIL